MAYIDAWENQMLSRSQLNTKDKYGILFKAN